MNSVMHVKVDWGAWEVEDRVAVARDTSCFVSLLRVSIATLTALHRAPILSSSWLACNCSYHPNRRSNLLGEDMLLDI
jgi:hypothetical protein